MIKFFTWLFSKLRYSLVPTTELNDMQDRINYLRSHITDLETDRNYYRQIAHDQKEKIQSVEFRTLEEYKNHQQELEESIAAQEKKNAEVREEIENSLKFYRTVEKRLSEVLHSSDEFGFPSGQVFPGSICGQGKTITNIDGKDYVVVDGRGVLPEEVFDTIKNEPYVNRRYTLALSCLGKYNMFDSIVRSIISNGGVEFSLGYNGENQTYELYYRLLCRVPSANDAINILPTNNGQYQLDDKKEG